MTAIKNLNRCKFSVASAPGAGTISIGLAAPGYRLPGQAGAVTGDISVWEIEEATVSGVNWEICTAVYDSVAGQLNTRTTLESSNSGSPVSFGASATVACVVAKQLLAAVDTAGNLIISALSSLSVSGPVSVDAGILTVGRYAAAGQIVVRAAAGSSGTPTQIAGATSLLDLVARGYDNAATYRDVAGIAAASDGAITSTSSPGSLAFLTTPSGAVTKLERARFLSSGEFLVGYTAGIAINGSNALVQSHATSAGAGYSLSRWTAGVGSAQINYYKSRGAAIGTNAIVVSGDELGRLRFYGDDGTATPIEAASVLALVDATPGTGNVPGAIAISTRNAAGTLAERVRLSSAGNWLIGQTADPASPGLALGSGKVITFADGSTQSVAATGSTGGKAANRQTFTGSGTWTKPSGFGANAFALIEAWGGGGSGANATGGGGGGGGGYAQRWVPLSSLGATETVALGAGGASQTTASTAGLAGGNTTFGSWLTGYGGAGGQTAAGGGGGGQLAAGSGSSPGAPVFLATTLAQGAGATSSVLAPAAFWHGGGGGINTSFPGGNSIWGGAGGGGAVASGTAGTSAYGGAGGAGAASGAGTAGSQPGGGGGGVVGTASGNGATGQVRVTVFDGA